MTNTNTATAPRIDLFLAPTGYIADFSQASDAASILALFGTLLLPTAFTAKADPARVLAAVQAQNVGHIVTLVTR